MLVLKMIRNKGHEVFEMKRPENIINRRITKKRRKLREKIPSHNIRLMVRLRVAFMFSEFLTFFFLPLG